MKRIITAMVLGMATASCYAQDKLYPNEFPLGQVTLLDGVLKHARDLNIETLLKYDCDRLPAPVANTINAFFCPFRKLFSNSEMASYWQSRKPFFFSVGKPA